MAAMRSFFCQTVKQKAEAIGTKRSRFALPSEGSLVWRGDRRAYAATASWACERRWPMRRWWQHFRMSEPMRPIGCLDQCISGVRYTVL